MSHGRNPNMVNTINPADCLPGEVYEGTVRGERRVLVRRYDDFGLQWESLSEVHDHEDVSDLVRLVPARPITRDDLPHPVELLHSWHATTGRGFPSLVSHVLDEVVAHLNANGGVPVSREDAALADRLERQATSIAKLQGELETAERDRSRWRRAHGIVEQERITARATVANLCEKLAEYSARAAAAEARTAPAVTKAEIEQAIRGASNAKCGTPNAAGFVLTRQDLAADAVWSLVSGADPAVFVVRESDLPEVERDKDGDWVRGGVMVCGRSAELEMVRKHVVGALSTVADCEAVARAIEAGQATDPVEQLADEFARDLARNEHIGGAWSMDPADWRDVTLALAKRAKEVLGQEASDE